MGLISGSGSFTRFAVQDSLPEDHMEKFPQRIARYAFKNIDEASDQERSFGWVNIMDEFDNRFASMEYLKEPCIAMSWRVDQRKVPVKALLRYCREAEEKVMGEEKLEYVPKFRKRELKEAVWLKLIRRAIPRSQTYDMIWNLQTGTVIFGATSSKVCDEFAEFFLECFGFHLDSIFPYTLGLRALKTEGLDPDLLDSLDASVISEVH
jgi:DNA recombination-dependent growth factor C